MRKQSSVLLAALVLALSSGYAPVAAAQDNPFGPVPTEAPTVAQDPSNQEVSRSTLLLVGAAVIVGVVGIGYAIARDARRSAPGDPREAPATARRKQEESDHLATGEVSRQARQRARKQRGKAKQARQQRKRNRGR